jgi:hypothetical protein
MNHNNAETNMLKKILCWSRIPSFVKIGHVVRSLRQVFAGMTKLIAAFRNEPKN